MEGLAVLGLIVGIWTTAARLSSNKEVLQANAATQQKIELLRQEQRNRAQVPQAYTEVQRAMDRQREERNRQRLRQALSAKEAKRLQRQAWKQNEADARAAAKANYVKY